MKLFKYTLTDASWDYVLISTKHSLIQHSVHVVSCNRESMQLICTLMTTKSLYNTKFMTEWDHVRCDF